MGEVSPGTADAPRQTYERRRAAFAAERDIAERRVGRLANARLVAFLAAVVVAGAAVWQRSPWLGAVAVVLLAAFAFVVRRFAAAECERRHAAELVGLNAEALARLDRDWEAIPVPHEAAVPVDHPYAADLDLFGPRSLYHLLDTTGTRFGAETLADWLLAPTPPDTLGERQRAVAGLAPRVALRDELAVRARLVEAPEPDPAPFLAWAEGAPWLASRPALRWVAWLSPLLMVLTAAAEVVGWLPAPVWLVFLALNILVRWQVGPNVGPTIGAVAEQGKALFSEYAGLFAALTAERFEDSALAAWQSELTDGGAPADRQLRRLQRIAGFLLPDDAIGSMIIATLTLWDIHLLAALEGWQADAGPRVRGWLRTLGRFEAAAALARLAHDNPGWVFAEVNPAADAIQARALGHPLIAPATRVANDVEVGPPGSFLLVTGSNMAGKSTLLRAIGVNVVLAQAGGPVCAEELRLPPVDLWTSMRVQDSLAQGVSFFLAELRRLKLVVDAARCDRERGGARVLYLLDEVLNGTNTAERQIAVRRIVRRLVEFGAIGAVSTHDLTLADSADLAPLARPVYFTETVAADPAGPAMSFDYRLRPGLAPSRNALRLMELIGLAGGDEPQAGVAASSPGRRSEPD
ncbi:MAG TPA: hypothetical protein VFN57_04595 [Thermomicrobiaceae bacterium]|nr:hypothetical protein [Thermomicrobiaceae bacterium]